MTPTPRSRAGSSVTSRPWRWTLPESGRSSPAMTRRMVVFPEPDAPSRTSASPSATSKETSSSTRTPLKLLLRPRTLAAGASGWAGAARGPLRPASGVASVSSVTFSGSMTGSPHWASLAFDPVAREEEDAEDGEGEEREHDGDGVGRLDLALVELGEDVERRGLRAARQVARDQNRRAELADGARERQERARHEGSAERGQ